jgi:hypothetical protein
MISGLIFIALIRARTPNATKCGLHGNFWKQQE